MTVTQPDTRTAMLDAVTRVLARKGLAGVTVRAVAEEAGVAIGSMNYHFDGKDSLIAAALERVGAQDAELVARGGPNADPVAHLLEALARVVDDPWLEPGYLGLRLQLWSLAPVDPVYAEINHRAQVGYRNGLRELIADAVPTLDDDELDRRAADVLIVQNGMWLTSILIPDRATIERGVRRCEAIALAPA